MRWFLLFVGWASLIGSVIDGALILYALFHIFTVPEVTLSITVDEHLKDHLPFIYWIKGIAYATFPAAFVEWLFGLNAIVYFSLRFVINFIVGKWALKTAEKYGSQLYQEQKRTDAT